MLSSSHLVALVVLGLIVSKAAAQGWLVGRNALCARAHAGEVPESFRGMIDAGSYTRAVEYTLAKLRLRQVEGLVDTLMLVAILFSGLLPFAFQTVVQRWGASVWSMAGFLLGVGVALGLSGLPLEWYAQFRLEERFGFNTMTGRLWWLDHLKGLALGLLLGYPLLALILELASWAGGRWWVWAWACVLGFQLVLVVVAPILILPWFNRFTPLPEGSLRQRLLGLAERVGFRTRSVQVMDGSRRSRHSNAFFTGFGRFRKVVLFDTLIEQLTELELAAVLAHELGHWKQRHVAKGLLASAVATGIGFYLLSVLASTDWFYRAFGFAPGNIAPAFLVFGLLSGVAGFWFSPVINGWSRRHEYQADAFAASMMGESMSMARALRKLHEINLGNLTPDPLYSFFFHSHPTLLERIRALDPRRLTEI